MQYTATTTTRPALPRSERRRQGSQAPATTSAAPPQNTDPLWSADRDTDNGQTEVVAQHPARIVRRLRITDDNGTTYGTISLDDSGRFYFDRGIISAEDIVAYGTTQENITSVQTLIETTLRNMKADGQISSGAGISSVQLEYDAQLYKFRVKIIDGNNKAYYSTYVDLPIETLVVSGRFDTATNTILLTLKDGTEIPVPVGQLIAGLASEKYVDDHATAEATARNNAIATAVAPKANKSEWARQAVSNTDLDTIQTNGVYRINTGCANRPSNHYGQLLVVHGGGDTCWQAYMPYEANHLWIRTGNAPKADGTGTWTEWKRLARAEEITTAVATEAASRDNAIAAAVATEATARDNAIATAISTEVTNRNTAITTAVTDHATAEATARDKAISTAISTEVTNRNTAITTAVSTEVTNRDNAISDAFAATGNITPSGNNASHIGSAAKMYAGIYANALRGKADTFYFTNLKPGKGFAWYIRNTADTANIAMMALTMDSNGGARLGIGKTSPSHALDVNGSVRASSTLYGNNAQITDTIYAKAMQTTQNMQVGGTLAVQGAQVDVDSIFDLDNQDEYVSLLRLKGKTAASHVTIANRTDDDDCGGLHISFGPYQWLRMTDWSGGGASMTATLTGNLTCTRDVTAYSDRRLKTDIHPLDYRGPLDPVTYIKDGQHCIGFVAQDVRTLYPELVHGQETADEYLSLNYGAITAVLAAENRELRARLAALEARLATLEDIIKP